MPGLLDLRAAKGGFDLRVMLVGVVSDEDEVSSWVSKKIEDLVLCCLCVLHIFDQNSPRCARYLAELSARADTSLSDSEPSVSYSVIGM